MTVHADTVHAEMLADGDGHHGGHLPLFLRWTDRTPAFVEVNFPDDCRDPAFPDELVTWEISRTLLALGGGVPGADVYIDRDSRDNVLIVLRVDALACAVQLPAGPVDALLARTFELVPFGDEVPEHQVDAFLARALEATP